MEKDKYIAKKNRVNKEGEDMWRETIISIIIILTILLGNHITQNYTSNSIDTISKTLEELKLELSEEVNKEKAEEKIKEVDYIWKEISENMAYYIEHDELEKVETNLISLRSLFKTEEYAEAINELDKSIFILKHIENKNAFTLKNIF